MLNMVIASKRSVKKICHLIDWFKLQCSKVRSIPVSAFYESLIRAFVVCNDYRTYSMYWDR